MGSGEEKKGLRPNPKRGSKGEVNIGELMSRDPKAERALLSGALKGTPEHPEFLFLAKWGLKPRELLEDPRASDILSRLYKVWPRLSANDRLLYLQIVENIAKAEKAKNAWNPKPVRSRHIRLAKDAAIAAELVCEISAIFPPPWEGEREPIGYLMRGLGSFMLAALAVSFPMDKAAAADAASKLLRKAKKRIEKKARGMHWELVRDLVWLASGQETTLDERTVRRYLEEQPFPKRPADRVWQRNWDLVGTALRLARGGRPWVSSTPSKSVEDPFFSAARTYLRVPSVLR
jgi:hypothetical protein